MKIIQSFWSGNKTVDDSFGWISPKYHWISWILSSHQLIKHHSQLELYTDSKGYEILIEKLNLPYTKVHVVLDELNKYHPDLWAVSKIKTYELQNEAFLHVDGDVFVWESLAKKFKNSKLCAQNLEISSVYYKKMWEGIEPHLKYLPPEFYNNIIGTDNYSCNMGIVGGNDIDFFKNYAQRSFDFVNKNKSIWDKINSFNFNIFFEQVLFYQLTQQSSMTIDFIFNEAPMDNQYIGFADFDKIPDKTYLHLLGDFKKNLKICENMEVYAMKYYPETYLKLNNLSMKSYNNFIFKDNEKKLLSRNLISEGLPLLFDRFLTFNLPFYLKKLDGIRIKDIKSENQSYKLVVIDEVNDNVTEHRLDKIDEILFYEMESPILYKDLLNEIEEYLDEDVRILFKDFLQLINDKLRNYIYLRIITIYS